MGRRQMKKYLSMAAMVLVGGALVSAQDYIFTNFAASRDIPVPAAPCLVQGSVQPVVYDTSLWFVYTCYDGSVIARRFFHPNDQASLGRVQPVMIVQPSAGSVNPPTTGAEVIYDTTDKNWQGTGGTEAEWRLRFPIGQR